MTTIGYRSDKNNRLFRYDTPIQFLDAKLRMMQDGVSNALICGASILLCVRDVDALLRSDISGYPHSYWPTASDIGWEEATYQEVVQKQIPTEILQELTT